MPMLVVLQKKKKLLSSFRYGTNERQLSSGLLYYSYIFVFLAKEKKREFVLGKIRKFTFQNKVSTQQRDSVEESGKAMFSSQDVKLFRTQLVKAMDDFVVRREVVVSNLHSFFNSMTTVTFTKASCFQSHKH